MLTQLPDDGAAGAVFATGAVLAPDGLTDGLTPDGLTAGLTGALVVGGLYVFVAGFVAVFGGMVAISLSGDGMQGLRDVVLGNGSFDWSRFGNQESVVTGRRLIDSASLMVVAGNWNRG